MQNPLSTPLEYLFDLTVVDEPTAPAVPPSVSTAVYGELIEFLDKHGQRIPNPTEQDLLNHPNGIVLVGVPGARSVIRSDEAYKELIEASEQRTKEALDTLNKLKPMIVETNESMNH